MKNNKGFVPILIVLIIIGVLALGGGIYYFWTKKTQQSVGCTQGTKLCPDGSAVGRTGPNCEFAECSNVYVTTNWKTCINTSSGFSVAYPINFEVDSTTCSYAVMDYNNVKDIIVSNSIDDFRKNWLLVITAEKTSSDVNQWIKDRCSASLPSCSETITGPIVNSEQYDLLNVHYAETDTVVSRNGIILKLSLNARNPNTPINQNIRDVYNQILSTFRFSD